MSGKKKEIIKYDIPPNSITVQQIIMPNKPDFMDKKRLAEELSVSTDTIDRWMKKKNFLIYNKHYFIIDRVIRFNYQEIKLLLAPRAFGN